MEMVSSDEELCTIYSAIDLFVHASAIGESYGMVLAEAMACETAVVTLATPQFDNAQAELVESGAYGYVVQDLSGLIEVMRSMTDTAKQREFGAKARDVMILRYSGSVVAQRFLRLVRALCAVGSRQDARAAAQRIAEEERDLHDIRAIKAIYGRSFDAPPRLGLVLLWLRPFMAGLRLRGWARLYDMLLRVSRIYRRVRSEPVYYNSSD